MKEENSNDRPSPLDSPALRPCVGLADTHPNPIWICSADGQIQYANASWKVTFGKWQKTFWWDRMSVTQAPPVPSVKTQFGKGVLKGVPFQLGCNFMPAGKSGHANSEVQASEVQAYQVHFQPLEVDGLWLGCAERVSLQNPTNKVATEVHSSSTNDAVFLPTADPGDTTWTRRLSEVAPAVLWLTDVEGNCTFISQSWFFLTGQTEAEAMGRGWLDAVHPDDRERTSQTFREAMSDLQPFAIDYRLRNSEGIYRWSVDAASPRYDVDGTFVGYVGTVSDVHDRKQVEEELERSRRQLTQEVRTLTELHSIGSQLPQAGDLQAVADMTLDGLIELLDADKGTLQICTPDNSGLTFLATRGFEEDKLLQASTIVSGFHSTCGRALELGRRVIVEDFETDSDAVEHRELAAELGYRAAQSTPLIAANGQIVGMITTHFNQPRTFSERELRVIDLAVQRAASFIEWAKSSERLERSEERFHNLADNISQLAWMADTSGWIFWYNRRWFDYTGTNLSQMQGWGWKAVHHPDHVDRVVEKFSKCLEEGSNWEDTFPLRRHDGQYRWFLSRAIPIRDESGKVVRWFGTNTDVTELRRIEEELRAARYSAEEANRAKSDFLANVSHEIRSPMTAILGYVELLNVESEQDREKIETIRTNGEFLLTLINDILDLSRIEAGKFTLDVVGFSPENLVTDVAALMKLRAAEKGLNFQWECADDLPKTIQSDPVRIRQILINLVGNAIKFTESGEVSLSVEITPDQQLAFSIEDTGIGMSSEQLQTLFRPFQQADSSIVRRYGGSGLGLSISQRLAEMVKGSITVESQLGIGSRFVFQLPLDVMDDSQNADGPDADGPDVDDQYVDDQYVDGQERLNVGSAEESKKLSTDPNFGKANLTNVAGIDSAEDLAQIKEIDLKELDLRVLIVDDRRDIRFLVQHFVRNAGASTVLCENGLEAIAAIEQHQNDGCPFDIVLMDMQMPVMDGVSAVTQLRASGYTKPIIALTANAMEHDRQLCMKAGYNDFLTKPVSAAALVKILRTHAKQT